MARMENLKLFIGLCVKRGMLTAKDFEQELHRVDVEKFTRGYILYFELVWVLIWINMLTAIVSDSQSPDVLSWLVRSVRAVAFAGALISWPVLWNARDIRRRACNWQQERRRRE